MMYANISYFPIEMWNKMANEEIQSINRYDDALRYGSSEMGTRGILNMEKLKKLYYEYSCNNTRDMNCWGLNQLVVQFLESARMTIANATEGSPYYAEMVSLLNGLLGERLKAAQKLFETSRYVYCILIKYKATISMNLFALQ